MDNTSLKLAFLFTLTVIAFCSSLVDAREMAKEEVNCLSGNYPDGKKNGNYLPPAAPIMDSYETDVFCRTENECIKYCPKGFKIADCNFGTCFCER